MNGSFPPNAGDTPQTAPKIVAGAVILLMGFLWLWSVATLGYAGSSSGDRPALERILQSGVLRVGVNPGYKPFSYLAETQLRSGADKLTKARLGVDIDIAALLAKSLGVQLVLVSPQKFEHLIPMLRSGEIDIAIAAMSRVFERALLVDFTDPYFDTGFSILLNTVKGHGLGVGEVRTYPELIRKLEELGNAKRLVVAVARGKSAAGSIERYFPQAKKIEFETNEDAAEAVYRGDAHVMVHDITFLKYWLEENPEKALYRMVVFPQPFKPDTYGFAVAKGNLPFITVLNLFIADKLIAEGYLEEFIAHRHFRYIEGIGIEPVPDERITNETE